jgi:hypothetical protein
VKTHVEFRSNKFPPYDGEQTKINPGLWGKRLAEYFVQKLPQRGIAATSMIPEDWGWYVPVEVADVKLAICCGHQNGDDDEFLCFTDPGTPMVKKFFKKIGAMISNPSTTSEVPKPSVMPRFGTASTAGASNCPTT